MTTIGAVGLALAATMTFAGVVAPASADTAAYIPDAKLSDCLKRTRAGLFDPKPFTVEEVKALRSVSCTGVADLTGLEGATKLERFSMYSSSFSSLEPLSDSTLLESFLSTGSDTTVSDLTPLAGATGLRSLELGGAPTTSLAVLANMPDLYLIELGKTKISDLSPLSDLDNLRSLTIKGSLVTNLTPLTSISTLEDLTIASSFESPTKDPLSDLSPLKSMTSLSSLDVSGTSVHNLSPIAGLTGLHSVGFSDTTVSSIEALRGMADLGDVDGANAAVYDISPLPNPTTMESYLEGQKASFGPVAPKVAIPNPLRGYGGGFVVPSSASLAAAGATLSADASTITFAATGVFGLGWQEFPEDEELGSFNGTITFTVATPVVPPVVTPPVVTPPVVTPPVVTPPVVTPPVVTPPGDDDPETETPPAAVTPPAVVTTPTVVTTPAAATVPAATATALASTGVDLTVWPIVAALLLLIAGAGMAFTRKRA
ncbi:hypothetical protein GCM10022381_18260 [Leifsonia kafniensis]|uniref:Leucine-rich repeat domain-containing protein n=1 Tax=Leifsonia kafniensis TaxID=475957 RepID=A0ABP7KIC7_9MICO